jgi:acyl-CoA thioester hydrolase
MSEPHFVYRLVPRWGDMDAYGHVNNAAFFTYLEECRVRWLHGLDPNWSSGAVGPVIAHVELGFLLQLHWPSALRIELHVEKIGTSSMHVRHRLIDERDAERVYAQAKVVLVWIDRASGKPTPVPGAFRVV